MNQLVIVLDFLGMLAFIVAAMYAYRNHEMIKFASNLWFYFATASVVAAVWSLVSIFQEIGVVIDHTVEPALYFAVIFLFVLFSVSSYSNFIKPYEKT